MSILAIKSIAIFALPGAAEGGLPLRERRLLYVYVESDHCIFAR